MCCLEFSGSDFCSRPLIDHTVLFRLERREAGSRFAGLLLRGLPQRVAFSQCLLGRCCSPVAFDKLCSDHYNLPVRHRVSCRFTWITQSCRIIAVNILFRLFRLVTRTVASCSIHRHSVLSLHRGHSGVGLLLLRP